MGEPKKGEDKKGPTSPKKITQGKDGVDRAARRALHAHRHEPGVHARVGRAGLLAATGDHAEWDVEVAKAGMYDVTMEWSVDQRTPATPL